MEGQQSNESENQGRPKRHYTPRTPKFEAVLKSVKEGEYDDNIFELRDHVMTRINLKRQAVLELVHQVYGENAQVVTAHKKEWPLEDPAPKRASAIVRDPDAPFGQGKNALPPPTRPNPFLERAQSLSAAPEPVEQGNGQGEFDTELDQVEAAMEEEVPIERRGASISGLHSSDIE